MTAETSLRARTRWGIVALAVSTGFVAAMQVGKVPPALPALRAELGIGLVAGGWIASLFAVTSATLGLVAGAVGDRLGARRTLLVALILVGCGSLLGGLADSLWPLLAARLIESVGFVGVVVVSPALIVAACTPRDRRLAVGIWSTYLPVGFALMLLLAEPMLSRFGWRALWFLNAGIVLGFLVLLHLGTRGVGGMRSGLAHRWREIGQTIARPGLWLLALCFLLYSLQWFAVMTWLPTFLIEVEGRADERVLAIVGLVVLVNSAGNLAGTWLLQQGTPRWVLIALSAVATALIGGGIYSELAPSGSKLWLAFAYSLLAGVTPAAALTGAVSHAPSPAHVGTSNGIVVQGAQAGSLLGPPILAFVVSFGGWPQVPWLFVAVSVLSLALALLLRRLERRA